VKETVTGQNSGFLAAGKSGIGRFLREGGWKEGTIGKKNGFSLE